MLIIPLLTTCFKFINLVTLPLFTLNSTMHNNNLPLILTITNSSYLAHYYFLLFKCELLSLIINLRLSYSFTLKIHLYYFKHNKLIVKTN
jgi:hypothetical protein